MGSFVLAETRILLRPRTLCGSLLKQWASPASGRCHDRTAWLDISQGRQGFGYTQVTCYTDFWEAYQAVIPEAQHVAAGKGTGETAHIERWNNTLRQRLGQFVRKTLSFSESDQMHEARLKLFLHRYNLDHA